jgi:hypothetical protein
VSKLPLTAVRGVVPPVRLVRRSRTVSQTAVFGLISAFLLAGLVTADSVPGSVGLVAVAAACAYAAVRSARASVTFNASGIVVRDTFRTHRIAWTEVTGLAPATDDFGHRTAAILTADERRVRLFALNSVGFWSDNSYAYQQICARAGDLIDRGRATARPEAFAAD